MAEKKSKLLSFLQEAYTKFRKGFEENEFFDLKLIFQN